MDGNFNIEDHKSLKNNPFGVPEGYFETMKDGILFLKELPKEDGFTIPVGYFEKLPARIHAARTVPEGYFDSLAERIKSRIREEENNVPVISLERRSTRMYWGIAAGMALMIGFSSLFFYLNSNTNMNAGDILLSESSKALVIENPEQYNIDESALLEEMGVSMEETTNAEETEEILLESEADLGSEITETE